MAEEKKMRMNSAGCISYKFMYLNITLFTMLVFLVFFMLFVLFFLLFFLFRAIRIRCLLKEKA